MKRITIACIVGALLVALVATTGVAKEVAQAVVSCQTTDPVCQGGEGPDDIFGTNEADEIWAGGGGDFAFGFGGADTIYGQQGKDYIEGGTGNDILQGNADDDDLYGGDGDDTVSGNAGQDYLEGNRGDDVLAGGENNDDIDARGDVAGEEDFVYGGPGNDEINSQDGVKDTIQCGSGTDTVFHDAIDVVAADCENKSTGAPPAGFLEEKDL